jgi:hypothetical protein
VELNAAQTPSARARRQTMQQSAYIDSIGWTRDASAVVYSAAVTPQTGYLWRVSVDGTRPPALIEVAGSSAFAPAIARKRDRLAFTKISLDADIYRFDVGRPAQLVVGLTFWELGTWSHDAVDLLFRRPGDRTRYLARVGERWDARAADPRSERALRVPVERGAVSAGCRPLFFLVQGSMARRCDVAHFNLNQMTESRKRSSNADERRMFR